MSSLRLGFATGYRTSTFAVGSSASVVLPRFGVAAFGDLASGRHVRSSRGARGSEKNYFVGPVVHSRPLTQHLDGHGGRSDGLLQLQSLKPIVLFKLEFLRGPVAKSEPDTPVVFALAISLHVLKFRQRVLLCKIRFDPRSHTLAPCGPRMASSVLVNTVEGGYAPITARVLARRGARCDLELSLSAGARLIRYFAPRSVILSGLQLVWAAD